MLETIIGFAVGYYLGTQHGREGFARVVESWNSIRQSRELQGLIATALEVGGQVLAQNLGRVLGERVREALPVRLPRAA